VHGQGRGRQVGIRTANLEITPGFVMPAAGVYAVRVRHRERVYPGAVNLGWSPTFPDAGLRLEVHLLGYSGNLYGEWLALEWISRLRPELRFDNAAQLVERMRQDIAQVAMVISTDAKSLPAPGGEATGEAEAGK